MIRTMLVVLATLMLGGAPALDPQATLIRGARVFDGTGSPARVSTNRDGTNDVNDDAAGGADTAANALRRRPLVVFPARLATTSPVSTSALRRPPVLIEGFCDNTRAATPATCGVAIDVPLRYASSDAPPPL